MGRSLSAALLVVLFGLDATTLFAASKVMPGGWASVSEDGGRTWRLVEAADVVADKSELRTSGFAECTLSGASHDLVVAADSQLSLVAPGAMDLLRGGVRIKPKETGVSVHSHDQTVQVAESAEVAIEASATRMLSVNCLAGMATVRSADNQSRTIKAGEKIIWSGETKEYQIQAGVKANDAAKQNTRRASQGLGQLIVNDAQSGSPVRLNIARYHVNVVLEPPVALVQIDQSFYNPFDGQNEGTFVFNLPRGASVSRFAMYVTPEQLIEGELIERKKASDIYESIVRRRRDPAILEQIGDSLFQMRVFPIFAHDTKRILLDYTVPLEALDSRYRFDLPLLSDLKPIWDFRVSGTVRGAIVPESIRCLTHGEMEFRREGEAMRFEMAKQDYRPESDCSLTMQRDGAAKDVLRTYMAEPLKENADPFAVEEDERQLYFCAELPKQKPAKQQPAQDEAPDATDVLVLVDTSAEAGNLANVRASAKTIVHSLGSADRFQIVCYDSSVRRMTAGWTQPGTNEAETALAKFNEEFLLGGSHLELALQKVEADFLDRPKGRNRIVLHVVGTVPTLGVVEQSALERQTASRLQEILVSRLRKMEVNYVALLMNDKKELTPFADGLAREVGGKVFGAQSRQAFFQWLLSGSRTFRRISSVSVAGAKREELYWSDNWLPGEPLRVLGRGKPTNNLKIDLTYEERGQQLQESWELEVDARRDDVFLGRLWGQKALDRMTGVGIAPKEQIIALSQEWSLLSPLTAFLVLESEADYPRWNIVRSQRRRYWRPADAEVIAPLPKDWIKRVTPALRPAEAELRLAEAISSARRWIEQGDAEVAESILSSAAGLAAASASNEFTALREQVRGELRRGRVLGQLGLYRSLLETKVQPQLASGSVWNLLQMPDEGAGLRPSADFRRQHPHYQKLLQTANLTVNGSIDDLADALRQMTGLNVMVDQRALEDAALRDVEVGVRPSREVSLYSLLNHALGQLELALIEEPEWLLLTTREAAREKVNFELYPIDDLFRAEKLPALDAMVHPIFDREEAARRKILEKLERSVKDINVDRRTIPQIARQFESLLGSPVLVDRRALEEAAIGLDVEASGQWKNVSPGTALKWLLRDFELTYVLQHESLVITTLEKAAATISVRTHSLRGVVVEQPIQRGGGAFGGRGMGGGMGGMGGGGFGGMMGGFGGGLGRFAGGGAGGAVSETNSPPEASSGDAAVSDSLAEPAAANDVISVIPAPPARAAAGGKGGLVIAPVGQGANAANVDQPPQWVVDFDSIIELITTSIQPNTWDDVGGPGSIKEYEPTLDLVVAQTDEIHGEVERLLRRLRRMPIARDGQTRLAQVPKGIPGPADFDGIINLITTCCSPNFWDDVGGPCSVKEDSGRDLLVIGAYPQMHDEVTWLLTRLRRNRYEALQGTRPWERNQLIKGDATTPIVTERHRKAFWQSAASTAVTAEELSALSIRKQPPNGSWKWRRIEHGLPSPTVVRLRRKDDVCEVSVPGLTARSAGERGALGYDNLLLVRHTDAATVQALLDMQIPAFWHRANEDLARAFAVEPAERRDGDPNGAKRLRMRLAERGEQAWIEGVFDAAGNALGWEGYLLDRLAYRLRIAPPEKAVAHLPRSVELQNSSGQTVVNWELLEHSAEAGEAIDVAKWQDEWYQLHAFDENPGEGAFHQGLAAAVAQDFAAAERHFATARSQQPKAPLAMLLHAWCFDQARELSNDADDRLDGVQIPADRQAKVLAELRQVARSGSAGLRQFISPSAFSWLQPAQEYELMKLQLEPRAPEDWARLVRLARAAKELEAARRDAEGAWEKLPTGRVTLEMVVEQIGVLHELGKAEQAGTIADRWIAERKATPGELTELAEALARSEQFTASEKVFALALQEPNLSPGERSSILLRRAAFRLSAADQLSDLLQAAAVLEDDSPEREEVVRLIEAELGGANATPALAHRVLEQGIPWLQARLIVDLPQWVRELEPVQAGDLAWKLYESKLIPQAGLPTVCGVWNEAKQPKRVVAVLEAALRKGERPEHGALVELQMAYDSLDQPEDALRVGTTRRATQELGFWNRN